MPNTKEILRGVDEGGEKLRGVLSSREKRLERRLRRKRTNPVSTPTGRLAGSGELCRAIVGPGHREGGTGLELEPRTNDASHHVEGEGASGFGAPTRRTESLPQRDTEHAGLKPLPLPCPLVPAPNQGTAGAYDKYSEAVDYFDSLTGERRAEAIYRAWGYPPSSKHGCLFEFLESPNCMRFCGCPTQIKHHEEQAFDDRLTQAIRNDPDIPMNRDFNWTRKQLERLAYWQRFADRLRASEGRNGN